ncbi:membrane-bound lytic murein transglycosylase D [compost metagenome]
MQSYKIKENDTIEIIAKSYNMSIKELIDLNKIKDREKLGIGNVLKVKSNDATKDGK